MKALASEILMGNKPNIEELTDVQVHELALEIEKTFNEYHANEQDVNGFVENLLEFTETIDDKEVMVELVRYPVRTQAIRTKFLQTMSWITFSKANKPLLMGAGVYARADARFGKYQ